MNPADVPVVILCGGKGTRIREASESLPKPMIDIGGRPMVWHIMKIYHAHGFRRFVLCLGYKSWLVKEWFLRYRENILDFTVDARSGDINWDGGHDVEDWQVTCAYTGESTLTGGRLSRVRQYLDEDHFLLTYGDGVADIDLPALLNDHVDSGRSGTLCAVHPTSRFGELDVDDDRVRSLAEKPELQHGLVNGGFFAFRREVLDLVHDDDEMLETGLLQRLVAADSLGFRYHGGFWRGMDTYREYVELNELWEADKAPWKVWS